MRDSDYWAEREAYWHDVSDIYARAERSMARFILVMIGIPVAIFVGLALNAILRHFGVFGS